MTQVVRLSKTTPMGTLVFLPESRRETVISCIVSSCFPRPSTSRCMHSRLSKHTNPPRQPSVSASVRNANRCLSDSLPGVCPTAGRGAGCCGAVFAGIRYFSLRRNPPRFSRPLGRKDHEEHFLCPPSNTHCPGRVVRLHSRPG